MADLPNTFAFIQRKFKSLCFNDMYKDQFVQNMEIMFNCLLAETQRIKVMKSGLIKDMKYDEAGRLHDIGKKLESILEDINDFY